MSLQALVDAIEAAGTAEADAILADVAAQETSLAAQAEADAAAAWEAARREALQPLNARSGPLRLQAQLDAAHALETARAQLIADALAATTQRLAAVRASPDYPALLGRLLAEALAALDSAGPLHVDVDPRDEALVTRLLPPDRPVTIRTPLTTAGGLCLATADGRLQVDNTLEERLAIALPRLRRLLADFFLQTEA